MNTYKVKYGFRKDAGGGISTPTHTDTATVKADSKADARRAAIDAAYAKHPVCSHVQPLNVEQVDNR